MCVCKHIGLGPVQVWIHALLKLTITRVKNTQTIVSIIHIPLERGILSYPELYVISIRQSDKTTQSCVCMHNGF